MVFSATFYLSAQVPNLVKIGWKVRALEITECTEFDTHTYTRRPTHVHVTRT